MTETLTIRATHAEHATDEELRTAATLGRRAYDDGRPAAPGTDRDLLQMIGNVPVGRPRTRELMTAWSGAYQGECDAAADAALLAAEHAARRKAATPADPWAGVTAADLAPVVEQAARDRAEFAASLPPMSGVVPSRFD